MGLKVPGELARRPKRSRGEIRVGGVAGGNGSMWKKGRKGLSGSGGRQIGGGSGNAPAAKPGITSMGNAPAANPGLTTSGNAPAAKPGITHSGNSGTPDEEPKPPRI